jgi:hypothetical protein
VKRCLTIILLIAIALTGWGCAPSKSNIKDPSPPNQTSDQPTEPGNPNPTTLGQSQESLGGLRLGMTVAEVEAILGKMFTTRVEEEGGAFREAFTVRTYTDGCDVVIGKTSGKVLQIEVYAAKFPTELGVKIGDNSLSALQKYRDKYPEFVGNQSPAILTGWFMTEPGILLIFSSMENRERSNRNLTADSRIHAITLGYSKFFD